MLFFLSLLSCTPDKAPDSAELIDEEPNPIYWEECSYKEDEHICNFTYANALDTTTTLYDYYGEIVVIEYFVEWCRYCREAAEMSSSFVEEDVTFLSVMLENQYGITPNQEDIERWASAFSLPEDEVLRAGTYILDGLAEDGPDITSLPGFIIVDEDMVIRYKIRGWSLQLMQQTIAELKSD